MIKADIPYIISLDARRGFKLEPHIKLLTQRLISAGYSVDSIQFPRIEMSSSQFIRAYLNGDYGPVAETNPYLGALFATLDRLQASRDFRAQSKKPDVLLLANFVFSTLIDEASKIANPAVRQQYCQWLIQLEHYTYGIIYPDLSVLLDDSPEVSGEQSLARQIAVLFPDRCQTISTHRDHQNATITSLNNTIWDLIIRRGPISTRTLLDTRQSPVATDNTVQVSAITSETHLGGLIEAMSSLTQSIGANSGDGNAGTSRDSFSSRQANLSSDFGKVDSLIGFHLFIGNVSCLLAERLKGHDGISHYQHISSDVILARDPKLKPYFTPTGLDNKTGKQYQLIMDKLVDNYYQLSTLIEKLPGQNDALRRDRSKRFSKQTAGTSSQATVRGLWPASAYCRLVLFASFRQYRDLIGRLRADDLPESRELAQQIELCLSKTYPNLSLPKESPEARRLSVKLMRDWHSSMKTVSNIDVSSNLPDLPDTVTLLDHTPRNEFQLLPQSLFEYSSLSHDRISEIIDSWSYDKKVEVLRAFFDRGSAIGIHLEKVLKKISYSWELVSDMLSFQQLHHPMNALATQYQSLTPRYGYDIPQTVEAAGLSEQYQESFDLSYQLFSVLQKGGYDIEAQYATLLGHRLRWTMTSSAWQMARMHDSVGDPEQSADSKRLTFLMWDQLSAVHPILSECLLSISRRSK